MRDTRRPNPAPMFQSIVMIDFLRPLAERKAARKFCGPYTWTPTAPGIGRGFYQSSAGLLMDRAGSSFALRLEYANDVLPSYSRIRQTSAYWADDYGDTTLTPIVARLPRSRGFLAGWTMGEGMAACVDATIWETAEDAARAAHDLAERDAEAERECREPDRETPWAYAELMADDVTV